MRAVRVEYVHDAVLAAKSNQLLAEVLQRARLTDREIVGESHHEPAARIGVHEAHHEALPSSSSRSCAGRREAHRDFLVPVDEVRTKTPRRPLQLELWQTPHELFEHDANLETREARAEAEVLPRAEGEVLVGGAPHVEFVRIGEDVF